MKRIALYCFAVAVLFLFCAAPANGENCPDFTIWVQTGWSCFHWDYPPGQGEWECVPKGVCIPYEYFILSQPVSPQTNWIDRSEFAPILNSRKPVIPPK